MPIMRLRPNAYEPTKAYLVVYNRPGTSTASIDLNALWGVTNGQTYSIVSVENIWGTAAASGTWNGIPVGLMLEGTFAPQFSAYLVTKSN